MAKILVERPRVGGCGKELSRRNRHETRQICKNMQFDDDLETSDFRGMKRVHTATSNSFDNKKQLNENLKPLRRFLNSRIGQPWDKVYSEIMSKLNLNNSVQYHVWQHLVKLGEVETKTYMEGDTVMAAGVIGPQSMTTSYGREEFYVDPRDGTLRKTKRISSKYSKDRHAPSTESYSDPKKPLTHYHKIAGVWYEFSLREATSEEKAKKSFGETAAGFDWEWRHKSSDKFVDQITSNKMLCSASRYHWSELWRTCQSLFGGAYLPVSKRQISSKEIRKVEDLIEERSRKFLGRVA